MSLKSETAKPSLSGKRSLVTAWFPSSFLGTPIRLLKSVMMKGAPLFGVSWKVFLRHPARQYGVSAQIARLLASCAGGQHITIGARSSFQFRSLMAPASPCNFGSAPNVLTACLGFLFFFLLTRMDTRRHVRESCLLTLPSHFEMQPMLSNGQLVCGAVQSDNRYALRSMHCRSRLACTGSKKKKKTFSWNTQTNVPRLVIFSEL